jgi:hypothetical protein
VTASFDYRLSPVTTLGGGVGAGLGGVITVVPPSASGAPPANPRRFLVLPGWEATLSYSRRLLDGHGNWPFLVLGISGGGSGASTRQETLGTPPIGASPPSTSSLYAIDVRAGLLLGKTFWKTLSPYAALRGFGGPVLWEYAGSSVTGTDRYHYQVGGGLVTALPRGFDMFVEGVPLGERAITLGVGKAL